LIFLTFLEPSPAAHRAMIAGLAAGIDGALLLVFKKLHQFGNGCFVDTEALLAGMGNGLRTSTPAGLPGRGPRVADCGLRICLFTSVRRLTVHVRHWRQPGRLSHGRTVA